MAKELSEGIRGQIIALSNEGFLQRTIAEKIKLSKSAVQRTFERFRDTESYSTNRRSGRPRATTLKVTSTSKQHFYATKPQRLVISNQ